MNPEVWGRRLAMWIRHELLMRGFATGDPFAEDWGWVVPLENHAFPLWVGCANHEDGYLVIIEPSKPFVRRWLVWRIDTRLIVERVAGTIDYMLRAHPEVRDVRWWA